MLIQSSAATLHRRLPVLMSVRDISGDNRKYTGREGGREGMSAERHSGRRRRMKTVVSEACECDLCQ